MGAAQPEAPASSSTLQPERPAVAPFPSPRRTQPAAREARASRSRSRDYATCPPEQPGGPEPIAAILPRAWAQLLGRWDWQWFITLTFKDPVHPEQARKYFDRWLTRLDRERRAVGFFDSADGLVWALGLERQQRGVLHFHVVLANVGALPYRVVRDHWPHGYSWVQRARRVEDVTAYVAKYVAKGGEVDLHDCGVTQKGHVARWPARVYAQSTLRRALKALAPQEQEQLKDWATRDRRPSTRPDELVARARAAAESPKASRRVSGPELDGSEPQAGS
jgi:hypothetical protein